MDSSRHEDDNRSRRISFSSENKLTMTYHVRKILDDPRNLVQINSKFDKLRVALNGAIFDDRGMLVKDETPYNDILDTFFMACTFFNFSSYTFIESSYLVFDVKVSHSLDRS